MCLSSKWNRNYLSKHATIYTKRKYYMYNMYMGDKQWVKHTHHKAQTQVICMHERLKDISVCINTEILKKEWVKNSGSPSCQDSSSVVIIHNTTPFIALRCNKSTCLYINLSQNNHWPFFPCSPHCITDNTLRSQITSNALIIILFTKTRTGICSIHTNHEVVK